MRSAYTFLSVVALGLAISFTAYMLSSRTAVQETPALNIALIEALSHSGQQPPAYRVIPESIMTGLCWTASDGAMEGVFKDVNSGMSLWREREPDETAVAGRNRRITGPLESATGFDYRRVSAALEQLSFDMVDYRLDGVEAELAGILRTSGLQRQLLLAVELPATPAAGSIPERVAMRAMAELEPGDLEPAPGLAAGGAAVNFCISLQAARESLWPAPSSGQPLTLSHYY